MGAGLGSAGCGWGSGGRGLGTTVPALKDRPATTTKQRQRMLQTNLHKQPQGTPRRASVKTLSRTTLRGLQKPKPVLVICF